MKKTGNESATMYFAVDDAKDFARHSGTELLECRPLFTDARRILWRKTTLYTRVSMKIANKYGMTKLVRLRL